jgi:hypothetical protein
LIASVTVVSGQHSIRRSIMEQVSLVDVERGEPLVASFGTRIEQGKPSRTTVHEIGESRSKKLIGEIPEIKSIIDRILEQAKNSAVLELRQKLSGPSKRLHLGGMR